MEKSREEAVAAGVKVGETKHNMKRRSPWHDYRKKGTYMLTLVVEGRGPLLGRLVMEPGEEPPRTGTSKQETETDKPDTEASKPRVKARVELTMLGKAIVDDEVRKITEHYQMVEVWRLCIMPDHIHMIVRVKEDMPEGKNLGQVVWGFKVGCTKAWWRLLETEAGPGEKPPGTEAGKPGTEASKPGTEAGTLGAAAGKPGTEASAMGAAAGKRGTEAGAMGAAGGATVPAGFSAGKRSSLFEEGYNDKILLHERQLDNWKRYLDDNPRRLAIKRLRPDLFKVISNATLVKSNSNATLIKSNSNAALANSITNATLANSNGASANDGNAPSFAGHNCQIVGNRFLLDIPEKMAVIVHGAYSDAEYGEWRRRWLACGENGGVLVSAAIAAREKKVLREAMDMGYRIILLRENGFPPLYKPSGESFEACSDGRLLQISPWPYHMERKTISREQCLKLNRLAEMIADGSVNIGE